MSQIVFTMASPSPIESPEEETFLKHSNELSI